MRRPRLPEAVPTVRPVDAAHGTTVSIECGSRVGEQSTDGERHHMPPDGSLARGSRSQRSPSDASIMGSTPPRPTMMAAPMGQPQPVGGQSLPHAAAAMSIGSIIEPSMRSDLVSSQMRSMHDLSSVAIGVGPRTLPHDLVYSHPMAAESPLLSSESCYSPMSDYLQQPQVNGQRYLPSEAISRAQSTSVDPLYHPNLLTSPLSGTSVYPGWDTFDPAMFGGPIERSYLPTVGIPHRQFPPVNLD